MQKETYGLRGPGSLHEDPSRMDNQERHQHLCALENRVNEKGNEILERHGINDPVGVCQKIFDEKRISGHIKNSSLLEDLLDYSTLKISFHEAEVASDPYGSAKARDLKLFWETVKEVIAEEMYQNNRKF